MTVAGSFRPDLADVRPRAEAALRTTFPESRISSMQTLAGGASSLTMVAECAGAPVPRAVVKIAPAGLAPVRNRDVLGQARLLSLLVEAPGVRVPTVYGVHEGEPPATPPLFVMSYVEGESYEPLRDEPSASVNESDLRGRVESAAQMLASLQKPGLVDRLTDVTPGGLVAEIERWGKALRTVPREWVPNFEACERRLAELAPTEWTSVIAHGDWRLGNMQCVGGEVRAVIDWEIWSVGDPRLDLAWMSRMLDPTYPTNVDRGVPAPTAADFVALYETASGRRATDLDWFYALSAFKSAATSALLAKNALKRGEESPADQWRVRQAGAVLQWCSKHLSP